MPYEEINDMQAVYPNGISFDGPLHPGLSEICHFDSGTFNLLCKYLHQVVTTLAKLDNMKMLPDCICKTIFTLNGFPVTCYEQTDNIMTSWRFENCLSILSNAYLFIEFAEPHSQNSHIKRG